MSINQDLIYNRFFCPLQGTLRLLTKKYPNFSSATK
jgi:hypothetical protein